MEQKADGTERSGAEGRHLQVSSQEETRRVSGRDGTRGEERREQAALGARKSTLGLDSERDGTSAT